MRRLVALVSILALAVALPTGAGAVAQEASPVAEAGMPSGIPFAILALGVVEQLPPGPAEIGFGRMGFAPGSGIDIDPEPWVALIAVESGTFTFTITTAVPVSRMVFAGVLAPPEATRAGVAFTVGPGESVVLPPFATGEVRNAGPEPVVALIVYIEPSEDAATEATPAAREEAPAGITFEPLAFGAVEQLPPGPAKIDIVRTTIAPGVTFPQDARVGVEVDHVEAGSLTLRTTGGPAVQVVRGVAELGTPGTEPIISMVSPGQEVTVSAGDAFFIPAGSVTGGEVVGNTEVVALIAIIEPLGETAATPEP